MKTIVECPSCQQQLEIAPPPRRLPLIWIGLALVLAVVAALGFNRPEISRSPLVLHSRYDTWPHIDMGRDLQDCSNAISAVHFGPADFARFDQAGISDDTALAETMIDENRLRLMQIVGVTNAGLEGRLSRAIDQAEQSALSQNMPAMDRQWHIDQMSRDVYRAEERLQECMAAQEIVWRRELAAEAQRTVDEARRDITNLQSQRASLTTARDQRQAQIAFEYQQSAVALAVAREQNAAKATAVHFAGDIFQVVADGVLANCYINGDVELGLIQDSTLSDMSDGTLFTANTFYPIGTYRYSTVAGGTRQVKKFTMSLTRAVEFKRTGF